MDEIERLEDLPEDWQRELLALSQNRNHVVTVELWRPMHNAVLIRTRGDLDELTTFAGKLISDYQQRHGISRTIKPTYEQLEAENVRLRAALDNHGLWVDFNHLSKVLEDIRVTNWLTVHANALGFAIGYFRHLQSVLDGKENPD